MGGATGERRGDAHPGVGMDQPADATMRTTAAIAEEGGMGNLSATLPGHGIGGGGYGGGGGGGGDPGRPPPTPPRGPR